MRAAKRPAVKATAASGRRQRGEEIAKEGEEEEGEEPEPISSRLRRTRGAEEEEEEKKPRGRGGKKGRPFRPPYTAAEDSELDGKQVALAFFLSKSFSAHSLTCSSSFSFFLSFGLHALNRSIRLARQRTQVEGQVAIGGATLLLPIPPVSR